MVTPHKQARTESDWIAILANQCASKTKAQVAREIGYSRTTVSLALSGTYDGSTDKLAQAVLDTYADQLIHCPHLRAAISDEQCVAYRSRPMPLGHAADMRHWRACQRCPFNAPDDEGGARHAA